MKVLINQLSGPNIAGGCQYHIVHKGAINSSALSQALLGKLCNENDSAMTRVKNSPDFVKRWLKFVRIGKDGDSIQIPWPNPEETRIWFWKEIKSEEELLKYVGPSKTDYRVYFNSEKEGK